MELLVVGTIQLRDLVQVYHWQTKNYSHHKIMDKLYDNINDYLDRIVETWQGEKRIINLKANYIQLHNINEIEIEELIINYIKFLRDQTDFNSEIFAILEEFIEDLNKVLYLLTLK